MCPAPNNKPDSGFGGDTASSYVQGKDNVNLDFDAVQSGDVETEN